jgi:SagB-type dehydrogenase family enzyme
LRTPKKKKRGRKPGRKTAAPVLSARLNDRVTLEADADGKIAATFDGYAVQLGNFSAGAVKRAQGLRTGLPLASFASARKPLDQEITLLVRRLAYSGLVEYRLARGDSDMVVIEPQQADYWPSLTKPGNADSVALSRFAYLRRRGNDMVLESPRAGALFRICDPTIASQLVALSTQQKISKLRSHDDFAGLELFALLLDCHILFKVDAAASKGLRGDEGDENLVLWDFHDLLFHVHSTEGRQANPLGGRYPYVDVIAPPPAVRPPWSGETIDLQKLASAPADAIAPFTKLLRERHSERDFDDQDPIKLAELAQLLDSTARVQSKWASPLDFGDGGDGGPDVDYTRRPYPSAGSAYELELYLAVANCEGLERGFYHYDADRHAMVPITVRAQELEAMFASAEFAMDALAPPQILITIAARFNRINWKYSAIAYSLILKNVGVLLQTLYLAAADMGLGGCAIGTSNIDLFAKMTGLPFHVEGPVGLFALGRGQAEASRELPPA